MKCRIPVVVFVVSLSVTACAGEHGQHSGEDSQHGSFRVKMW